MRRPTWRRRVEPILLTITDDGGILLRRAVLLGFATEQGASLGPSRGSATPK
jgi:hypothetical protein